MDFKETLTEKQKLIYDIAKKYLSTHPHFTLEELLTICKRKSELTTDEISKILLKFLTKKIFVQGSRLTKATVLNNQRRAAIYQFIFENPGINFNQIITHFQIGVRVGYMHLEILKKFGFIRERKFRIFNLYFPKKFPPDKEIIIFLLRSPNAFNIYLCLKQHPFNQSTLAKILHLHHSTIQYHLKRLLQHKIVLMNTEKDYSLNPDFFSLLEKYFDLIPPISLQRQIEGYSEKKKSAPLSESELQPAR